MCGNLYSTANTESLLTSPLPSALPHVLKQCVNEEQDILDVALDIIALLVESGLFIAKPLTLDEYNIISQY